MKFYVIILLQLAILYAAFLIYKKLQVLKPKEVEDDSTLTGAGSAKNYLVSLDEAHQMVQTYRNPKRVPKNPDARAGWYPKGVITDYINYMLEYSEMLNIDVTGIRYYYAAYPDDGASVQSGYQTLVFYPTSLKNGDDVGFDPARSSMDMPFFVDEILSEPINGQQMGENDQKHNMHYISTIMAIGKGGLNKSHMCPPGGNC